MSHNLLARACGELNPQEFTRVQTATDIRAIAAASKVRFDGRNSAEDGESEAKVTEDDGNSTTKAHEVGVNCLTIDRFEGRYMLSGGSDSSLSLWDLEQCHSDAYTPVARLDRASSSHKYGVTHLSFYPFDSLAFLSSSYDHFLKIYGTETFTASASFDLGSVIYNHAVSPIADHLLVATATQHPIIRLVDLRSGAMAHSLAGHQGAVLCTAWSPKREHILASGGVDGTTRVWDIRRSSGSLGLFDSEDAVGIGGENGLGKNARPRHHGTAHAAPCNGVVWKDDGEFLVTTGLDARVRVWNVDTGADVLSHFGPVIKNTNQAPLFPLLVPDMLGSLHETIMFYPNEKEILMFDLFEGTLLKRLRSLPVSAAQAVDRGGRLNARNRITSLAWRSREVEIYSSHTDGSIRAWKPRSSIEAELDREESATVEEEGDMERKRKRQALDDMFHDLTRQKITFT